MSRLTRTDRARLEDGIAAAVADASPLDAQIRAIVRDEIQRALADLGASAAPELVTMAEYARARSISVTTVRAAIRDGRLEAHRIGRAVRVRARDEIARPVGAQTDRSEAARRKLGLMVVK